MNYKKHFLVVILFFAAITKLASQTENVDSSFQYARTLAFSGKHTESIALCKNILAKAPNYQDVQVLLARVYFWNGQTDSALFILNSSITTNPYADAFVALSDIQRFTQKPYEANATAETGLFFFPTNEELQIRKVKALTDLKEYTRGFSFSDSVATLNGSQQLRQLAENLKRIKAKNTFSINYDFDFFDKQYTAPWHLIAVGYGRRTKYLGLLTARANFANRYDSNGLQFEMDAYPGIGKKMYAYLNVGYSGDLIFPNYRAGISIYRNFPHAFEGEIGLRLLVFSKSTILYVASIGKYLNKFWISFRPTFIVSDNGTGLSQSYSLITRYYLKTSFDYITLTLGYGLSPDDRAREILLQNPNYKSYRINLAAQKVIRGNNIFSISAGLVNLEYFQGIKKIGNNYYSGLIYQKMF